MKVKIGKSVGFLIFGFLFFAFVSCGKAPKSDVVIIYTNDVHTYLGKDINYAKVSELKTQYLKDNKNVILVDCGDHVQGTAYGALDEGQTVIEMMNKAGYDYATLGNHEFDYGFDRFVENSANAKFHYLASNFYSTKENKLYLNPSTIRNIGGWKIAFIGIMTPETITKAQPSFFMDENETEYIYHIPGGDDGAEFYASVQKRVDEIRSKADFVVALAHLGIDYASSPYTSIELIENTSGIDILIDGHSHNEVVGDKVKNKRGKEVLLTQTGSYFEKLGHMTIKADGTVETALLSAADLEQIIGVGVFDKAVNDIEVEWLSEVDNELKKVVANTEIGFHIYDPDGTRIVRRMETNLGDFVSDAFYYYMNEVEGLTCDIAIANGGGIRADIPAGEWSYLTCKNIQPFGNVLCLVRITGQQIMEMLEYSTKGVKQNVEEGGFLHVAGMTFDIDLGDISQRVKNARVYNKQTGAYEPIDLEREYIIAGVNYILRNRGDGYDMLSKLPLEKDYIVEDYMATARYAETFAIGADGLPVLSSENSPLSYYDGYLLNYENRYGSGRIRVLP